MSLLIINPHLQNVRKAKGALVIQNKNTVYGTNCVLENLRTGDSMHFFGWPKAGCLSRNGGPGKESAACSDEDFMPAPLSESCIVLGSPTMITDNATLSDAAALAANITANHSTTQFDASDIWRVMFSSALPATVVRGSLVNVDSFSTPGTVIRNNIFAHTKYNLGRFKSNGGVIANNTWLTGGSNLEISPLLTYFEGNLPLVRDVIVAGNTIIDTTSLDPIHCSTMCGRALPAANSTVCPLCTNSAFAKNVSVIGNHLFPPAPAGTDKSASSAGPRVGWDRSCLSNPSLANRCEFCSRECHDHSRLVRVCGPQWGPDADPLRQHRPARGRSRRPSAGPKVGLNTSSLPNPSLANRDDVCSRKCRNQTDPTPAGGLARRHC
jgi:hypothetical protein